MGELFGGNMAASDQFYYEIQEEVNGVIREFGKQFNVESKGVYDKDTMSVGAGTKRNVWGLVADQQFASQLVPNGWTAVKSLILQADAVPDSGEQINVDGKWYSLSGIMQVKPAGVVVCYMLDVSR